MHAQKRCVQYDAVCATCAQHLLVMISPRCQDSRRTNSMDPALFEDFHQLLLWPSIQNITKVAAQLCAAQSTAGSGYAAHSLFCCVHSRTQDSTCQHHLRTSHRTKASQKTAGENH